MGKYLKRLDSSEAYTAFKNGEEYIEPHVVTVADETVIYKREIPMIAFTVTGRYVGTKTYTAEEGMTWEEWMGSEYCTATPENNNTWGVYHSSGQYDNVVLCGSDSIAYTVKEINSTGNLVYVNQEIKPIEYWYSGER